MILNGDELFGYFEGKRGLRQGDPMSPLLFVLCMEYLSRVLTLVGALSEFKFHPRCRGVKLNHLIFADDVILCCKGEYATVFTMLEGFQHFSDVSGLEVNKSKTEIFTSGMNSIETQRVLDMSGFTLRRFPFTYIGVPICHKNISSHECQCLIDKMIARIQTWSNRNLSYQGRLVLVNSVLLSINVYWAQIFIIPNHVMKEIENICRAYLWFGSRYNHAGKVAWDQVCVPKVAGGLGLRNNQMWNKAAIGRYIWAISVKKESLWLKWVHEIYIKNANWWEYKPPVDASWYWKAICSIKELMKSIVSQNQLVSC